MAIALIGLVACKSRGSSTDAAELARLRAEQAVLKARLDALEAERASRATVEPALPVHIPAPPSEDPPPSVAVRPAPVAPAAPPPGQSAAPAAPVLAVEDLRGKAPSSATLRAPEPTAASTAEQQHILEELQKQMETIKAHRLEQQQALDELERMGQ